MGTGAGGALGPCWGHFCPATPAVSKSTRQAAMQQLATRSKGLRVYLAWAVLCQWEVAEEWEGTE